ncbi:MAG: hypothetical protein PHX82_08665 [Paracoccaceae bacterium]|nr:hypothetical protein [Paracoccaceae bacterium]
MNKTPLFIALTALGLPAATSAQSLPEGVTAKGFIEYEYLSAAGNDASLLFGDFDISVAPGASGLGVDFGAVGLDVEATSEIALFGALTYTTGHHKFSVGVPRSALKDHTGFPDIGGSRMLSLEAGMVTEGLLDIAYLTSDETPIGLRYDGDFGALQASASYHRVTGDEDVDILGFGATYSRDTLFASGSLEHFDGHAASGTLLHAEFGARTDRYEAGLGISNGDNGYFDDTVLFAWGSYKVIPALMVTASLMDLDSSTIYGVSADYTVWDHAYAQLGYVNGDTFGDAIWDISVGWKF